MKYKFIFLLVAYSVVNGEFIYSQAITNLERIYLLLDKTVDQLVVESNFDDERVYFEFKFPSSLSVLENRVIVSLKQRIDNLVIKNTNTDQVLNFSIEDARIKYNNNFRNGLLGEYLVEREVILKGSFSTSKKNLIVAADNFSHSLIDTVEIDGLHDLENSALPFTKGEIPPEPMFPGLLEPAIAIGTAVVTILLFFTVRSK